MNETRTASGSTTMMQDYRSTGPGGVATKILTYAAQDGSLHLVTLNNDRNVYHLSRQTEGTTGWAQTQVALPTLGAATDIAVLADYNGPRLFAFISATSAGTQQVCKLFEIALGPDGTPGESTQLSPYQLPSKDGIFSMSAVAGTATTPACAAYAAFQPLLSTSFAVAMDKLAPDMRLWSPSNASNSLPAQVAQLNPRVKAVPFPGATWPRLTSLSLDWRNVVTCSVGLGQAGAFLNANAIPLTPSPALVDFDAVVAGETSVTVVAVDGSATIYSCTFDTSLSNPPISWSAQKLTGTATPQFTRVRLLPHADGSIDVALIEGSGAFWLTRTVEGIWDQVAKTMPPAIVDVCAFDSPVGGSGFVTTDQSGVVVVHSRSEEWDSETVELQGDERLSSIVIYRVALSLDGVPDDSREMPDVVLTPSVRAPAVLNGSPQFLDPLTPTTIPANGSGQILIDIEITDTIAAPILTFESPAFSAPVFVEPHQAVGLYLASVPAEDLATGVDPLSNNPIVPPAHNNPADIASLQQALQQVGDLATSFRDSSAAFHGRSWRFGVTGGALSFELVEHGGDPSAFLAIPGADSFLGVDWGAAWDAVLGGFATVGTIVVNGAKASVSFLINGVNCIASAVLDFAHTIYDLVTGVFDRIGTILGTIVGWLLKKLGFLFDWEAILELRDRIKTQITTAFSGITGLVTDPNVGAATLIGQIQAVRGSITQYLAAFNASPAGSQSFDTFYGTIPTVAEFFTSSAGSVFSQATWVIDKLKGALPSLSLDLALPNIPGLATAVAALPGAFSNFSQSLLDFAGQTWTDVLSGWIQNIESLTSGNFDPLVAIVAQRIDAVCAALQGVVSALAQVLHTLWAAGDQVVAWLDSTIYIPFFSSFYKAVVESNLSVLDLVCLGAAIPLSLQTSDSPDAASASPDDDPATQRKQAVSALLSFGVLTRGVAAFFEATSGAARLTRFTGLLDNVTLITASILMLYDDDWKFPGTVEIIGSGLAVIFSFTPVEALGYAAIAIGMWIGLLARTNITNTFTGVGFLIASCVQFMVSACWAWRLASSPSPPTLQERAGLIALYVLLSSTMAVTYIVDTQT